MNAIFESGLPETGPAPIQFFAEDPSPGHAVVRVTLDAGSDWVANLECGHGYSTKIVAWSQAGAFFVFAKGATYFLSAGVPQSGQALSTLGIDCIVSEGDSLALVSTYYGVVAVKPDGSIAWSTDVAVDGVVNLRVEDGKVLGDAGMDPPDVWEPFALRMSDGVIVSPR